MLLLHPLGAHPGFDGLLQCLDETSLKTMHQLFNVTNRISFLAVPGSVT
jgi:hypothetical protein